jgi:hypothetical protein
MVKPLIPVGASGNFVPPALFAPSPGAAKRFIKFFIANICNPNTGAAYALAVRDFAARWDGNRLATWSTSSRFTLPPTPSSCSNAWPHRPSSSTWLGAAAGVQVDRLQACRKHSSAGCEPRIREAKHRNAENEREAAAWRAKR